ncbi:MAG TPA: four helix bundle protein [Kiritimatiellia bacterium]|nr:four helix bundle protein [Kiritimatiellia bacterium]HPJ56360.1 four helix bundle protein [Kiritimatiellia bacterium]HPR69514.1 four helix bundle protein [Kiritimatiellia bacterium]HRX06833.1 four helix bundle protein [Kiritimatiellia bacterium]
MAGRIASFEDLEVYQLALELQQEIFRISKAFPKDETYSLTDQVRRSSRSIGGNIGEAWAKRRYPAHFISKLSDSDGEQNETRHWLRSALLCGYMEKEAFNNLMTKCKSIGGMLGNMMQHPDAWTPLECRK